MPSAIELFSGCGGLSTGLIAAGFEVLSAVEINQTAADTYGLNHPTVNLIVDDVRNVTAVSLLRRHNLRIGELDLLAGCSPCQGFSYGSAFKRCNVFLYVLFFDACFGQTVADSI